MRATDSRLAGIALVGLACGAALAAGGLPVVATAAAGAALALGVPGAAMRRALFPGEAADVPERVALGLGLSLSLAILGGFLLHLLPPGLSAASWGILLGGVTAASCAVAWLRERALADRVGEANARAAMAAARVAQAGIAASAAAAPTSAAAAQPPAPSTAPIALAASTAPTRPARSAVTPPQLAMLVGAGCLMLLALLLARAGAAAQPQPGFTALWIEPDASGSSVRVSVTDLEGHPQAYRLVVTVNGAVVAQHDDLAVAQAATVATEVALPPAGAVLQDVAARLWRAGDANDAAPYRSVRASVRATGARPAPGGTSAPSVP